MNDWFWFFYERPYTFVTMLLIILFIGFVVGIIVYSPDEIVACHISPKNTTSFIGVDDSIVGAIEPCSSCLPRCEGELDAHVAHYRAVQSLIVTEKVRSGLQ